MSRSFKMFKWILGSVSEAMSRLRNIAYLGVTTPHTQDADSKGVAVVAPTGGVWCAVDPSLHDSITIISADAIIAEYSVNDQTAFALDECDPGRYVRHPGAKEWSIQRGDLHVAQPVNEDSIGIVVRTAQYGAEGLLKNVFFPLAPKSPGKGGFEFWAHHRAPNPNVRSTIVHEVGRQATTDDQWRVVGYNPALRPYDPSTGNTGVKPPPPPADGSFATALNGAESGVGENRGHIYTWFGGEIARLGYHMNGPLRPASRKHIHSLTQDGPLHAGALDLFAKFTNGNPAIDGPLDITPTEEPPVADDEGFWKRVWCRPDNNQPMVGEEDFYPTIDGPKRGRLRWAVRSPFVEAPPCTAVREQYSVDDQTWDDIGGPEVIFRGIPTMGGIDGLAWPDIHKLAR